MARFSGKRRYRKWSVRAWGDAKFRALSAPLPNAQTLYMYLVLGPYTVAFPSAFRATRSGLAEDLGWPPEAFDECFAELEAAGMVRADWGAKVVYVPNALTHNQPESPNVCKAWAKAILDLPDSPLQDVAVAEVEGFLEGFTKGYADAFAQALGNQSRTEQKTEQEHDSPSPFDDDDDDPPF